MTHISLDNIMCDNYIVLNMLPSGTNSNVKRVITIENTLKGGVCRSCKQTLRVGEPRIKVAYPHVVVQYAARMGSPSFFMHPSCFESQPVDFCRIGQTAYKETISVQGFALLPEIDVVGWNEFPAVHTYFERSRAMFEQQLSAVGSVNGNVSSTSEALYSGQHLLECNQPSDCEALPSNLNELEAHQCAVVHNLPCSTSTNDTVTTNVEYMKLEPATSNAELATSNDTVQDAQSAQSEREDVSTSKITSRKRGAECIKQSSTPVSRYTLDADWEESNLKREQMWKRCKEDIQLSYLSAGLITEPECAQELTENAADQLDCTKLTKEYMSTGKVDLKEPTSRTVTCGHCFCHAPAAEREWASPKDAAEMLGLTAAILRNLADTRAVPVFLRPSGQRVYNLPSIRKYIAENTLPALSKVEHQRESCCR